MESKNKFLKNDIENCACYYFDDIMRAWDRDIDTEISGVFEKLCKEKYKKILFYDISYNTSMGSKPLCIR